MSKGVRTLGNNRLPIISGLIIGLTGLGSFLYWVSPGWKEAVDWRAIVFEALLFLFVFSWNIAVLPQWKFTKTLCLGSLLFLIGSFTDVVDQFLIQPRWVNIALEDPTQALGAGLIGLGIWYWVKERERLLEKLEKERDFEASVIPKLSHDLRVPLTNMSGITALLEEDPKLSESPTGREYLDAMWRGVKEMSLLIDNILETHRLKSGTVELKSSTISLVPLLEETCKDFHYQIKKKEITIVKDYPDKELMLEADRVKVIRIIQNLLANAIKFSPKGGKIALKTGGEDGEITIRIIDEGPGIQEDQVSIIMQEAPSPKKKGPEGPDESFGIGLIVVREFVHLHGGRFWIEPNSPKGAQCCFALPLSQPRAGNSDEDDF